MQPSEIADRYYAALDDRNLDDVVKTLAPDCSANVPGATLPAPAAIRGWMQAFFDAFPNITHEHEPYAVDGNTVSTTLRIQGTHTEPLVSPEGTIPPTNKAIDFSASNRMVVDDATITSLTIDFDQAAFMQQLGM